MVHTLKIYPHFFSEILKRTKRFECRKDDRGFKIGDSLLLEEYRDGNPTGCSIRCDITYILQGEEFGIMAGYVVMGIDVTQVHF